MNKFKKEIFKEYEKLRTKSNEELKRRKQEIYSLLPRTKEIDKEMAKLSISISKKILSDNNGNYESFIKDLESKINTLKKEKALILTENNFTLSYIKLHHNCEKCDDTGFDKSTNKLCECFFSKLIKKTYKLSNLESVLEKENFSTFNIDLFSQKKYEDNTLSPRDNMKRILTEVESFVHSFNRGEENLLLYGTTGLGKTFICNSIAKALLSKGKIVVYHTAFRILEILENEKFNKNLENQEENKLEYYLLFNSDLLIIDDLGTEMVNSFSASELFNIINSRIIKNKSTIISTNLSPIQIKETYSDRVSSRVFGKYKMLNFYGPDLRWEK
ncbi:ATP-binding protein [Helicovermis profundi]|uniref:ATP-binding protein n=1 Tax=Helicovermis profundi TaxID=3065157 RepID=A0AAU9EQE9_9FIRM|nr:ATP-binding protein [Clostridia bacterium S502]